MKIDSEERFFTKLDWAAFWTATLLTFAVYFFTLGPSVGLEDSGELATAGAHLGVPHPPGYPFWTLCSWIFCKLFFWVTYMGHPTPAWAISCFSAVAGALAAGCTAMLICRSAHDFAGGDGEGCSGVLSFGGAVAGALTFALSPVEWSQSTIVEIYSLNALFLMWVFLLSYRWMRKPSDKILFFTAFVFGLGLTNYQVLLFAIVPLAIIILMTNIALFRDVFIYLIPVALTYQVLQIGQLVRADRFMQSDAINKHVALVATSTCPSTFFIILGLVVLVGALVAAAVLRERGDGARAKKAVLSFGGGGAAVILLSAFVFTGKNSWTGIFAPVAPLIEPWRYAFIAALVAGSVVAAVLAALEDADRITEPKVLKPLGVSAALALLAILFAIAVPEAGSGGYLGPKYPWAKSITVFWLLMLTLFGLCGMTKKGLCFAIPVAGMQIAVFALLRNGAMNGLTHPQSWWFGWPIAWNFVLLALAWLTLPHGRSVAGAAFFAQLGVSFYAYMPIVSDLRNPPMNWGYPRTWEGFKHAIMRGQYEAIGVPTFTGAGQFFDFIGKQMVHYFEDVKVQFTDLLLLFAPVPFIAGHWVVRKEHKKTFWQWMGAAAACFLMMSFLLILLANVKGDVQDGFIQKVKFISSHAMIALWIGYGLVFAGVLLVRFLPSATWLRFGKFSSESVTPRRVAYAFAGVSLLVAFIYPIVQNYTDDRMVFELGGCEQNGHTFGWQFGAYQLDGAKAIKDQLVADEEPLPDPDWPEAMEPFSIFFGGTDPGRFVPTYMIYAADYRPDVYLITQNALADDTYMSVERDLYGDEIWIPSKEDSGEAFNIYVDEVQRGVRPANGDLRIENGKVQVTGALGVMEINGILTKMMFDHDRLRHSFYVEESYVIKWMYPYLSPHGLIMKINRDETPYDASTAAKDQDFWDWYTRRLLKDPMYRRDFAGQKSFSKLRAAIAGLYANQGRHAEAAQAFREACMLYPASPEAAFRYAQECLLPFKKWDIALELMDYTDLIDPRNKRTATLRDFVKRIRELAAQVEVLEMKLRRNGKLSTQETFALAHAYYGMGRTMEAAQLVRPLIDETSEPLVLKVMSTMFIDARLDSDAERCLEKYLRASPNKDAPAWLELAKLQHRTGRRQAAQRSFMAGYRLEPQMVFEKLQRDQELYEIAIPLLKRRQ
ncbi:MAG: DUF2723 domain-containing protein [Kiritimatiellae bacterium]|nr:DUF2723 domain-containing protein [Kiritimatiellia bacterium]